MRRAGAYFCLAVLAAALVLAAGRHDLRTVRDLLLSCSGIAALVLPKPFYREAAVTIYHADCKAILPALPSQSVDLVWTDPPYGSCRRGRLQHC